MQILACALLISGCSNRTTSITNQAASATSNTIGGSENSAGDEAGAQWDQKWRWERYPIRDHGRISIPYNGYIGYSNGLEQMFGDETWKKQEPPPFANGRVGDKVMMCVVELPSRCRPGAFYGITYRTHDLRTGGAWEAPDSLLDCAG